MSKEKPATPTGQGSAPQTAGQTVLTVGRPGTRMSDHFRAERASIVSCGLAALDQALLDRVRPDVICCLVMDKTTDASQVLSLLADLGFAGRVVILAPQLPHRTMVLRELQALAPNATICLVEGPGR